MADGPWRFAIQILDQNQAPLRQVPVSIDWDPLREWLRFVALRQGSEPAQALALDCTIEPIWDRTLGQPYLCGLRACSRQRDHARVLATDFDASFFSAPARAAVKQLVDDGAIDSDAEVRCLPVAYAHAHHSEAQTQKGRFRTQAGAPTLQLRAAALALCMERTTSTLASAARDVDDIPVFVPQQVLAEVRELGKAEPERETGGLLIGHVCRDVAGGDLFVEVTAQLPARYVDASLHRLTFTSDTWTEFRSAIALRARSEVMVGWWHSHPVREWCRNCSEASQRECVLRCDFFSEDDRLLHRTVFPRAYSLALVVNVVGYQEPTFSLFGWRQGLIEPRPHHVLATDEPSRVVRNSDGMHHGQ